MDNWWLPQSGDWSERMALLTDDEPLRGGNYLRRQLDGGDGTSQSPGSAPYVGGTRHRPAAGTCLRWR